MTAVLRGDSLSVGMLEVINICRKVVVVVVFMSFQHNGCCTNIDGKSIMSFGTVCKYLELYVFYRTAFCEQI